MDMIITWSLAIFAGGALALIYGGYLIITRPQGRHKWFGVFVILFGMFIVVTFITKIVV